MLKAIVLAAGQGTRMKSDLPKVAHRIAGKPLVNWVLHGLTAVDVLDAVVVVGHGADLVVQLLPDHTRTALQAEQLGTGHATQIGLDVLAPAADDIVLVVPGDMPLLGAPTVRAVVEAHMGDRAATIVTANMDDPTGYGRIVRDGATVARIVEEKDATADERRITEVNTSVYAFAATDLRDALAEVTADNTQGEYYLTDVVEILAAAGRPIGAVEIDAVSAMGVNAQDQLAEAARIIRHDINHRLMASGVAMVDPERVYVDADVTVAPGALIYPDVHLENGCDVREAAIVGPNVHASASIIGEDAQVRFAVLEDAVVGPRVTVGPFAYLRGGTTIEADAKAGAFVEMKNTTVGERSTVPHLSYMGDATIGRDVNVGAGSITCNYDGIDKNPTSIGDGAFIGSDTMLVAPVTVGDGSWTGAGSVITTDVEPGALAVERSQQRQISGYAEKRRRAIAGRAEDRAIEESTADGEG